MLTGQIISQAFENAISIFGERAARAIIQDLTRHGVFLNDPALSLEMLSAGIKDMAGEQAGIMIIERVVIELDRLCTLMMRK